jgi:hypothetical protein
MDVISAWLLIPAMLLAGSIGLIVMAIIAGGNRKTDE